MSIFHKPQYAEDFGFLSHPCLPTNLDGLTERHGKFLVIEVKRGEEISTGQHIMLEQLSRQPNFTVLVLNSRHHGPDAMNARPVIPFFYRLMIDGELQDPVFTDVANFRYRYNRWFLTQKRDEWL